MKFGLNLFCLSALGFFISFIGALGCGSVKDGFFYPALGLNEGRIILLNSVTNPVQQTATMYTIDGQFLAVIKDTSASNLILRGLAYFDATRVIVASDSPDQLNLLDLFSGEMSVYASNAQLNGNIYDVRRGLGNDYYVAESNTIEKFAGGARVPSSGATPYINTSTGSCVISTGRGITLTAAGRLVVVSNGNDDILVYDISDPVSGSCFTAYTGFGAAVNPMDAVGHSNGNIYITGNGDDTIYESPDTNPLTPVSIFNNIAAIDNPTAIAELPNGNLLIASDIHDSIVEITTSGTVVNLNFIKDAFTNTVQDILVIPPQ